MPGSNHLIELALRAGVNSTISSAQGGSGQGSQSESIQAKALQRASEMAARGGQGGAAVSAQMSAQAEAISLAVKGLALACEAIMRQREVLNDKRLAHDKELRAGIATFVIPTNVEIAKLKSEERLLKHFFDFTFESNHASFSRYLGIQVSDLGTEKGVKYYSVLPFYRMSDALEQPVGSSKPLDEQRVAIHLFLRSALPDAISQIDNDFQTDHLLVEFFKSAWERGNYLNDLKGPRLIMMALSNLLWNMQHPVDEDGYRLSVTSCMTICRDIELYLSQLLNESSSHCLGELHDESNQLMSFLRKIERHTKALRAAYTEEHLHELNIKDVADGAHHALRIMDQSIYGLIYKRRDVLTGKDEADESSSKKLAYMVMSLNGILAGNPRFIDAFSPFVDRIPVVKQSDSLEDLTYLNRLPLTVIDILIIFCQLSPKKRERLTKSILDSTADTLAGRQVEDDALEFVQTLNTFHTVFVTPIDVISGDELFSSSFQSFKTHFSHVNRKAIRRLTARRLVPLITLLLEDHKIPVDTPVTFDRAQLSKDSPRERFLSGKQQIEAINRSAETGRGYYEWALSRLLRLKEGEGAAHLDMLLRYEYRMTQMTNLIDSIKELVHDYRSFLQHKPFQQFLLKCLGRLQAEYNFLRQKITDIDTYISHDKHISRNLHDILRPLMTRLGSSFEAITLAVSNVERVVGAPGFIDQQRRLLASKLAEMHGKYYELFEEDSGLTLLLDNAPGILVSTGDLSSSHEMVPEVTFADTRQVLFLKDLVDHCYRGMSYLSRHGHKGALVEGLLATIRGKRQLTEENIRQIIVELTRITASYRKTCFFQAPYAQTRSAKALIAAIKDPVFNGVLPFASILFDNPAVVLGTMSDAQIMTRLQAMREERAWATSVCQIKTLAAIH